VFPSVWYEGQPLVLLEALASGLPVIASDIGAMREMFAGSGAGILFPPGDSVALARLVEQLNSAPETLKAMSVAARSAFLGRYTADAGYESLIAAYERVMLNAVAGRLARTRGK
jgi:glycosyltransferase involved in cell wall biosynthesis